MATAILAAAPGNRPATSPSVAIHTPRRKTTNATSANPPPPASTTWFARKTVLAMTADPAAAMRTAPESPPAMRRWMAAGRFAIIMP
nr:unnamed protein product [Digitaria exilis]